MIFRDKKHKMVRCIRAKGHKSKKRLVGRSPPAAYEQTKRIYSIRNKNLQSGEGKISPEGMPFGHNLPH